MLLKSRIYSNKSICYSQQNKILREGDEDPDYYSALAKLPDVFSLDFREKYMEFIAYWFEKEKLKNLPYDVICKQYVGIIKRITDDSGLGGELEIRKFKEFNTIDEILSELYRIVDGFSLYSMESNQDDKTLIEQIIKYISENYQKNINLATVSNHYNLNYSYFSRIFKDSVAFLFLSICLK